MTTNELLSPADVTAETKLADVLETRVCNRCGGSGKFSFNLRDGDRCWGCGGSGKQRTKRGAAALAFYRELTTVPAGLVREGDVLVDSMFRYRVTEIGPDKLNPHMIRLGGEVRGEPTSLVARPTTEVRVFSGTPIPLLKTVAAYQRELTKAGKIRKASHLYRAA